MGPEEQLPQSIKVDVQFYDDIEKGKLLDYPSKDKIVKIVPSVLEIPMAEFLTYYLFDRKRSNHIFYSDYDTVGKYINDAIGDMRGLIKFNDQSICTYPGVVQQQRPVSQYVGEAIGLSVISRIHELTKADWVPIREGPDKSFDYQIASTGDSIIEVECKGRSVSNNDLLGEISTQKKDILTKKIDLREFAKNNPEQRTNNLRYGAIVAIDPRENGIAKCRLTDPTPESIIRDPKLLRLFLRFRFLRDWISLISPRSQFSSALNTRLGCLENLHEPFELNKIPLKKVNGEPYTFLPFFLSERESSFFSNKSHVTDGPAGGIVVKLSEEKLFFLGIREDIVNIASKQNFEDIMDYKFPSGTEKKTIECNISLSRFKNMRLVIPESIQLKTKNNYVKFNLNGQIQYSSSGLVFGILPLQ